MFYIPPVKISTYVKIQGLESLGLGEKMAIAAFRIGLCFMRHAEVTLHVKRKHENTYMLGGTYRVKKKSWELFLIPLQRGEDAIFQLSVSKDQVTINFRDNGTDTIPQKWPLPKGFFRRIVRPLFIIKPVITERKWEKLN